MSQTSFRRPRSRWNASCVHRHQVGYASTRLFGVSRRSPVASAFMTQIALWPLRVLVNAMVRLSGDHVGRSFPGGLVWGWEGSSPVQPAECQTAARRGRIARAVVAFTLRPTRCDPEAAGLYCPREDRGEDVLRGVGHARRGAGRARDGQHLVDVVRVAPANDVDEVLAVWRAAGSAPSVTDPAEHVLAAIVLEGSTQARGFWVAAGSVPA